jgi:cytochrome c peroxidase
MKKSILLSVLLILTLGFAFVYCKQKTIVPEVAAKEMILDQIDSFSAHISELQNNLAKDSFSNMELQRLFLQSRKAYKGFEWAAEYFRPEISGRVNGPPVEEVELPDTMVINPSGLQVIEGYLFPHYDSSQKRVLGRQLSLLQINCDNYRSFFRPIQMYDWQILEAAKLEMFRVVTLGITGFDNPLTLKSMYESATSLESLKTIVGFYVGNEDSLISKFEEAIKYLNANPDFNSFNRMEFITAYCNPITIGISVLQDKSKRRSFKYNILLNQEAGTLFDLNAFNVNAYAPDHSSFMTPEKIILGKRLFSDPLLSGGGKRSCQSCHQPDKAFTDGLVRNTIIGKKELLGRNTPTLINAALQPSLFYDMRVNSLEDQSHSVVQSGKEMHGSMIMSVKRLWQDVSYKKMFLTAFPNEDKEGIDTFEIMNAIGSYIRSLVFLNSRFDEYMRGNKNAMNENEIDGFNLFMGKAKCATCHFVPLFNGDFPPGFKKMESEIIGVPETDSGHQIDPDMGRYDIIKVESFKYAFKIPTVRNASLTAPYMHNGVFSTLDQVVGFYNKGGGVGLGIHLSNQTLPSDSLRLNPKERSDIILFIRSLDSNLPH